VLPGIIRSFVSNPFVLQDSVILNVKVDLDCNVVLVSRQISINFDIATVLSNLLPILALNFAGVKHKAIQSTDTFFSST
jgi:hypothetical protein